MRRLLRRAPRCGGVRNRREPRRSCANARRQCRHAPVSCRRAGSSGHSRNDCSARQASAPARCRFRWNRRVVPTRCALPSAYRSCRCTAPAKTAAVANANGKIVFMIVAPTEKSGVRARYMNRNSYSVNVNNPDLRPTEFHTLPLAQGEEQSGLEITSRAGCIFWPAGMVNGETTRSTAVVVAMVITRGTGTRAVQRIADWRSAPVGRRVL